MKGFQLLALCTVLFVVGFFSVLFWKIWQVRRMPEASFTTQPRTYRLEPPANSHLGLISAVSGEVQLVQRDAEEAIPATASTGIREGDQLTTTPTGKVTVLFSPSTSLSLYPQTVISLLSTDPYHFLVGQDEGTVRYETDDVIQRISVRSLDALLTIASGSGQISTDTKSDQITFSMTTGTGQLGYISTENKTQMIELHAGESLIFTNEKRLVQRE